MIDIHNPSVSLRKAIDDREITIDRLADDSSVHRSLIHRILSGKPARSDTLAKLESALSSIKVKAA